MRHRREDDNDQGGEIGVVWSHARKFEQPPEARGDKEQWIVPSALDGVGPPNTLISALPTLRWLPELCERRFLLFEATKFVVIC